MKTIILIILLIPNVIWAEEIGKIDLPDSPKDIVQEKSKEKVLDFSAGVIEGELNRPSMLMELGSNYKEFNDLILLRDDFNSFHEIDSMKRFRYFDEGL